MDENSARYGVLKRGVDEKNLRSSLIIKMSHWDKLLEEFDESEQQFTIVASYKGKSFSQVGNFADVFSFVAASHLEDYHSCDKEEDCIGRNCGLLDMGRKCFGNPPVHLRRTHCNHGKDRAWHLVRPLFALRW